MAKLYTVKADSERVRVLADKLALPDSAVQRRVGQAIQVGAELLRAQAVTNTGGYPVVERTAGMFRVKVRTGTLRGSIETTWPYGSQFVARVYVNGTRIASEADPTGKVRTTPVNQYAGAIEWGHDEIDLKRTMRGKRVPFFASVGQRTQGPYAARGARPVIPDQTGIGSAWRSSSLDAKLQAKGKNPMVFIKRGGKKYLKSGAMGGTYLIAFRTVGDRGWVIPAARPRPFMRAAAQKTAPKIARLVAQAYGEALADA